MLKIPINKHALDSPTKPETENNQEEIVLKGKNHKSSASVSAIKTISQKLVFPDADL